MDEKCEALRAKIEALTPEEQLQWQHEVYMQMIQQAQEQGAEVHLPTCEHFAAFNTCYKDTGLFGVFGACTRDALRPCIEELTLGISRLCFHIAPEDLAQAKRELKGMLFSGLDNTTAIAEDIGRQLLVYGRHIPQEEIEARINALSPEDVMEVARKYFYDSKLAVTALGPIEDMPSIAEIKELLALRI